MPARRRSALVWLVLATVGVAIALPLARPLERAWRCYRLYADAPVVEGLVRAELDDGLLLLSLETGPQRGETCTARGRAEAGDLLPVVHLPERPGECELEATVEASGALLWAISGALAAIALLLVWIGLVLQRSFREPGVPARRIETGEAPACPTCAEGMAEGYVVPLAGVHWRQAGEPVGLPHALGGLPGTVGWRGRPRLHAFRCTQCEVLTLRYGKP